MVDIPIAYLQPPATIVLQALDRIGADESKLIGDLNDGSRVAETARRNYGQALRQLLRTAHWNFARRQAKLTLLGDASGTSPAPVSPYVEYPWQFAYAWPLDGVQGRWLPWNPTDVIPTNNQGVPLTTGQAPIAYYPLIPGRFLVSSTDKYPVVIGQQAWNQLPDLQRTEGVGPVYRKVILTDCCGALFVYTRLVTVIEEWDDLFRECMVMMMAMVLAPVAFEDVKRAAGERDRLIPILRNTIADARVANGNEAGWPQSVDSQARWVSARNEGGWGGRGGMGWSGWGAFGGGDGFSLGWDSMGWGGSVF